MSILYHFTNSFGGFSKGNYSSLNLADYVGDDKSLVEKNIEKIKSDLYIENLCFMNQIHGNKVQIVNSHEQKFTCDAIVTNQKNLALCVLVADCVPLLLYDEKNQVIAAVHAGRAGVFHEIATKTIECMKKNFNSHCKDITAFIGNCIHQCCYELSGKVLKQAQQKYPLFVKHSHLDIHAILRQQLSELNIKIIDESKCTSCNKEFFSYRRDGVTGRNAGIIMLKD